MKLDIQAEQTVHRPTIASELRKKRKENMAKGFCGKDLLIQTSNPRLIVLLRYGRKSHLDKIAMFHLFSCFIE
jgi:hypothetical protein